MPAFAAFWAALVLEAARLYLPISEPPVTFYRFRRASTSSSYDTTDTARDLGFVPDSDVDAKLTATVEWYRTCRISDR